MLIKFDDYPIQQTPEPLAYVATGDRNAYGRYWFNGYSPDGEFYFDIAFAVYPNCDVMDCALSIVRKDGTPDSFRASRRCPRDRSELRVGPFALDIVEPMRALRATIDTNSTGITADLTFRARTGDQVGYGVLERAIFGPACALWLDRGARSRPITPQNRDAAASPELDGDMPREHRISRRTVKIEFTR